MVSRGVQNAGIAQTSDKQTELESPKCRNNKKKLEHSEKLQKFPKCFKSEKNLAVSGILQVSFHNLDDKKKVNAMLSKENLGNNGKYAKSYNNAKFLQQFTQRSEKKPFGSNQQHTLLECLVRKWNKNNKKELRPTGVPIFSCPNDTNALGNLALSSAMHSEEIQTNANTSLRIINCAENDNKDLYQTINGFVHQIKKNMNLVEQPVVVLASSESFDSDDSSDGAYFDYIDGETSVYVSFNFISDSIISFDDNLDISFDCMEEPFVITFNSESTPNSTATLFDDIFDDVKPQLNESTMHVNVSQNDNMGTSKKERKKRFDIKKGGRPAILNTFVTIVKLGPKVIQAQIPKLDTTTHISQDCKVKPSTKGKEKKSLENIKRPAFLSSLVSFVKSSSNTPFLQFHNMGFSKHTSQEDDNEFSKTKEKKKPKNENIMSKILDAVEDGTCTRRKRCDSDGTESTNSYSTN
uniref:Uncharacterized protein n=1 Tax=Corethron hystrix TaxID=216773 RepID=A0A7S1FK39_9STRA|mmetsp:Transcript_10837/g.23811  ORF Transcript_10837/g.23811 Transcript_10837/m.23811 type:complete len:466 (+) Transcript_10837:227-1624(+)